MIMELIIIIIIMIPLIAYCIYAIKNPEETLRQSLRETLKDRNAEISDFAIKRQKFGAIGSLVIIIITILIIVLEILL
ncbi:hypothetical protein [Clostridium ihumii]|uniref:hypothetical protein n=1 Tax=Clostridium ihumii TaxID=1470356 RepID=UPI0005900760|nr:hypothetical protein [Clostridium ihumii]